MKTTLHKLLLCCFFQVSTLGLFLAKAQTTVSFTYTGAEQSWTVPAGVTSITIDAAGGQGGTDATGSALGRVQGTLALPPTMKGGRVQATIATTPGLIFTVFVGGAGVNGSLSSATASIGGFNGGGASGYYYTVPPGYRGGSGGGATDIRFGGAALSDRILVAGGGGGGGYTSAPQPGGAGGGLVGGAGFTSSGISAATGGTASAGGTGGSFGEEASGSNGTFGLGGAASTGNGIPGGGGGGYYGGGGGGTTGTGPGSGGGGGSSYTSASFSAITHSQGFNSGNGYLNVTYTLATLPLAASISAKTNVSCNGGSNGAATAAVTGGTGPYTYSWSPSGGTSATASGLSAGTYTCTITDANAAQTTATATITQPSALLANAGVQVNNSCNGGSNGLATVSVSGGTPSYTYSWAPAGGTAATAIGLSAGTYICTITDANACSVNKSVTITQPTALVASVTAQTNTACNGGSNGAATVAVTGGTPAYTYSWSPSGGTSATATGLSAGNYTCTITDANACSVNKTVTITQPTVLVASLSAQTNSACNGGSNGAATVSVSGGTPAYAYSWSPAGGTGATASGLAAGTYTCTVTDANACSVNKSVTITQPTALVASVTAQTNTACNGGSNGAATVAVTGGTPSYTYSWSPSGGTSATATGLSAGTYTCTITDANACSVNKTVTITQPATLVASVTAQTNTACNGGSNGAATVSVSGGTPAYTYSWSPAGGTGATASGLAAGTYTCTINDANACSVNKTITVTQPAALVSSISAQTNETCTAISNGSATVAVSGGTAGYTYSWAPLGGTAATATGLTAGTYICTIKDANLCSKTQTVIISSNPIPTAPTVTPGGPTTFCTGGSVSLSSASANGNQWYLNGNPIGGATAKLFTATAAGNYTVMATALGCSSATSAATSVTVYPIPATPTITAGGITTLCVGGSVSLTSSSATGNQWYLNGNAIASATASTYLATDAGNFTVIATALGCSSAASAAKAIAVNATPTVNAVSNQTFCSQVNTATTTFSGSVVGTVYNWTNSNTSIGAGASGNTSIASFTAQNAGNAPQTANISVTPTYSNGGASCVGTPINFVITVNPLPVITIINPPATICLTDTPILLRATPAGGFWAGTGVIGAIFSPKDVGLNASTLTYSFANTYGCSQTGNTTILVKDCVERHNALAKAVKIYPNPVNGNLFVHFMSDLYDRSNFRIYSSIGALVRVFNFTQLQYGRTIKMDLNTLSNGVYFLEGYNGKEKASFKFIINR